MAISIIRNYIAKQLFKKSGAIANSKAVDFSTNAIIKRLNNYNIKPTDITSEDQLLRVLSSVKQAENNLFNNRFRNVMENNKFFKKQADVIDMTGKKINPKSKIMAGRQVETEAEIAERIKKENKESIQRLKEKITDEPEDLADGGIAGMLGERTSYRVGKTAKKKKKKKRPPSMFEMMSMFPELQFREPVNFPYKSLEDIPPNVLAMLRKDPNFDLETFLTKVGWSDADKTRIQEKLRGKDEAWGLYSPMADMSFLNYQKFGESEPIGDGLLSIRSPSDADKVQTILHEMRHGKMKEPWFMKSSAIPKWVREYEERGEPHYLDKDIKDKHSQYRDTQKDVSGEELFVRFMDQRFGDVAEPGTIAGSDYKPYFDKILKDHWEPYAKRYEDILKEEKRVKSKPYGLAGGGIAGMLGEPAYEDEEHRVPYQDGELVQGETYMPPKKFYGIGLGPLLDKFMSEGRPRDKEGFHTTLNKNDLINLLNYLKEDQDINLEDELMFRFGRFDPEKNSQLHIGIGKDQKEIGFKKKIDFNKLLMGKANGGRIGFKNGKGPKMSRRTFLKGLGALAALPVFGKFFKFAKPAAKVADLTSVPIKNAEGMPAWFKPLVNRVIKEGDDVLSNLHGRKDK